MSQNPSSQLDALRQQIDTIDDQLVALLNERAQVAIEIGKAKRRAGLPMSSPARETVVVSRILRSNRGPLGADSLAEIFHAIIAASAAMESE
jgi:chorismate mutase/prephenate dehydratase